jgi:hypothetical protein
MKRRNVLASIGVITAGGGLVMSSGAFTSAEVERDVNIDVVGDPNAFLGLQYPDGDGNYPGENEDANATPPKTLTLDGETNLFKATNQFSSEITTFDVTVVDGEEAFDSIALNKDESTPFGSGDEKLVTVNCNDGTTASIDVEVFASGDGFSVTAVRTFTIDSPPETSTPTSDPTSTPTPTDE